MSESCAHYWIIETPNGSSKLMAVCTKCKAQKSFPAWLKELDRIENQIVGDPRKYDTYRKRGG